MIRLHDLRRTWATQALEAGIHPEVVSERLGHPTIGITLDTCSHVDPATQTDAADRVAALILGSGAWPDVIRAAGVGGCGDQTVTTGTGRAAGGVLDRAPTCDDAASRPWVVHETRFSQRWCGLRGVRRGVAGRPFTPRV